MVCALKYILVGNYLFLDQYFNAPHFFCSSFSRKKLKDWIRTRPNASWEKKNKVKLSDEIEKLPEPILDEFLRLVASFRVPTPSNAKETNLDDEFINLGPLLKLPFATIRSQSILKIAAMNEFQCCRCNKPISLSDIAKRREIILPAIDGHFASMEDVRTLCSSCHRLWFKVVRKAAALFWSTFSWRSTPLVNPNCHPGARASSIRKVVVDWELLELPETVSEEDVSFLLKNYPTVRLSIFNIPFFRGSTPRSSLSRRPATEGVLRETLKACANPGQSVSIGLGIHRCRR
jgi:hypothetical protein